MRRIFAAASAVLAATALAVGPVSQAQASAVHSVNISGSMYITDDESWPSSDEHASINFNGNLVVGTNLESATYTAKGCAGGEVRIEAAFTVTHVGGTSDTIRVTPRIRLLEGTSCSTGDQDGSIAPASFSVRAGALVGPKSYTVYNTAEGGDKASVTFSVRNTAA